MLVLPKNIKLQPDVQYQWMVKGAGNDVGATTFKTLPAHALDLAQKRKPGDKAIFSELSPRPHDTGMVTLISQSPNEFELHLRAILGLPIPSIEFAGPSASAVVLASQESAKFSFDGISDALALGAPGRPVDLRMFAKPSTLKNRRMGVALARDDTVEDAVARAKSAAGKVSIRYGK